MKTDRQSFNIGSSLNSYTLKKMELGHSEPIRKVTGLPPMFKKKKQVYYY